MIAAALLAPIARFLPGIRFWLILTGLAAGAIILITTAWVVLDARAVAARAEADAKQARSEHIKTIAAFNEYRVFTDRALAASRRAAESRAAVKKRLAPLREMTHAAPASDDGPVPPVTERFLDGLRLEFQQAGIVGADHVASAAP